MKADREIRILTCILNKNLYPDLRQIFGNDIRSYYQHYIDCGHSENRIATGYENERVGAITSLGTRDYSGVYNL